MFSQVSSQILYVDITICKDYNSPGLSPKDEKNMSLFRTLPVRQISYFLHDALQSQRTINLGLYGIFVNIACVFQICIQYTDISKDSGPGLTPKITKGPCFEHGLLRRLDTSGY